MLNIPLRIKMYEKGLSELELARKVGVSDSGFSRIIRGWKEPSMEIKTKFAEILGCKVSEIFPVPETQGR